MAEDCFDWQSIDLIGKQQFDCQQTSRIRKFVSNWWVICYYLLYIYWF